MRRHADRPHRSTGCRGLALATACIAGSACPPARPTSCGARRWIRRAAGSTSSASCSTARLPASPRPARRPLPGLHGVRSRLPVRCPLRPADRGGPQLAGAEPPRAGRSGPAQRRCRPGRRGARRARRDLRDVSLPAPLGCRWAAAAQRTANRRDRAQRGDWPAGLLPRSRPHSGWHRAAHGPLRRTAAGAGARRGERRPSSGCSPAACSRCSSLRSMPRQHGCWPARGATSSSRPGRAAAEHCRCTTGGEPRPRRSPAS